MKGQLRTRGKEIPANDSLRELWNNAEQGDALAVTALGGYFEIKVKDFAEAARWYRRAAEQGDALAQVKLGLMYEQGKGVPQDFVEAHRWLNLAASRAKGNVQKSEAEARDRVAAKMTPEQIAEAQRLAREWRPAKNP